MSISHSFNTRPLRLLLRYYTGLIILNICYGFDIECPAGSEESGPWVMPESTCRSYYKCSRGKPVIYYCPTNTFFNTRTKVCGGSGSCYEIVCVGREDGRYLDSTESCSRSYWCKGGRIMKIGPTPSQVGTSTKSCPDVSQTAARLINRPNRCENKDHGRYSQDENCSGFYDCDAGIETHVYTCPKGFSFNGLKCANTGSNTCTNFCTLKEDGFYPDTSTDCVQYVKCSKHRIEQRSVCPADTAFNGFTCVPKTTFFCPGKDVCKTLEDGFHLESCRNYFKCERRKTLYSASCSPGEYFNGQFCAPHNKMIECKATYFSKTCSGKDGFYTNHTSHCTSYYYCRRNGEKIDFMCPHNYVFNGKMCVPPNYFSCPLNQQSCEDKKDGYHLQTGSLCKAYYYCYNNNKITYYCQEGKIFNGDKCVASSSHTCTDDLACNDLTGPCSKFR